MAFRQTTAAERQYHLTDIKPVNDEIIWRKQQKQMEERKTKKLLELQRKRAEEKLEEDLRAERERREALKKICHQKTLDDIKEKRHFRELKKQIREAKWETVVDDQTLLLQEENRKTMDLITASQMRDVRGNTLKRLGKGPPRLLKKRGVAEELKYDGEPTDEELQSEKELQQALKKVRHQERLDDIKEKQHFLERARKMEEETQPKGQKPPTKTKAQAAKEEYKYWLSQMEKAEKKVKTDRKAAEDKRLREKLEEEKKVAEQKFLVEKELKLLRDFTAGAYLDNRGRELPRRRKCSMFPSLNQKEMPKKEPHQLPLKKVHHETTVITEEEKKKIDAFLMETAYRDIHLRLPHHLGKFKVTQWAQLPPQMKEEPVNTREMSRERQKDTKTAPAHDSASVSQEKRRKVMAEFMLSDYRDRKNNRLGHRGVNPEIKQKLEARPPPYATLDLYNKVKRKSGNTQGFRTKAEIAQAVFDKRKLEREQEMVDTCEQKTDFVLPKEERKEWSYWKQDYCDNRSDPLPRFGTSQTSLIKQGQQGRPILPLLGKQKDPVQQRFPNPITQQTYRTLTSQPKVGVATFLSVRGRRIVPPKLA